MKKLIFFSMLLPFFIKAQQIDKSYEDFDFQAGENSIFEDKYLYEINEKVSDHYTFMDGGGAASIKNWQNENVLSFDAFYTRLKPKIFNIDHLPNEFSIEYDTWLDDAYDGNAGVVVVFEVDEYRKIFIEPNKHNYSIILPNNETISKDNPEAYYGEDKFYNRWVHISIAVHNRQLKAYLDQYKMLEIDDILQQPLQLILYGDKINSDDAPIYLKNLRIATGFPLDIVFDKGLFVTHNIKFDVNKSILKPESITTIKQVKKYLEDHKTVKLAIGGHTDSDGTDQANLLLSQQRANAVKDQLIALGIDASRLTAQGFGESIPLDKTNTAIAKAMNRRVDFTIMQ